MPELKIGVSADVNGFSQQMQSAAKASDKFTNTMERVESGTISSKQAVRQLTQSADALNVAFASMTREMQQSDFGQQIKAQMLEAEQAAGSMKDAVGDMQERIKYFSSDTAGLDSVISGFQGMAGAASAVTGTMALFGVENDNVKNSLLKVQGALAVLNGIQTVAKVLNKDSAFMIRLKTLATQQDTAATLRNATAEAVSSAATKSGTIIQNLWNTAKAIGKALLGDYTGLLLVGAGAVAAYAMATSDAASEQDKLNESVSTSEKEFSNLADVFEAYNNELFNNKKASRDATVELKKFVFAIDAFNGSEGEAKLLLNDINEKFGEQIGHVKSLADAKKVLAAVSGDYIKLLKVEAEANTKIAVIQKMTQAYQDGLIDASTLESWTNKLSAELATLENQANSLRDKIKNEAKAAGAVDKPKPTGTTRPHKKDNTPKFEKGSYADKKNEISKLEDELKNNNLSDEKRKKLSNDIQTKKRELSDWLQAIKLSGTVLTSEMERDIITLKKLETPKNSIDKYLKANALSVPVSIQPELTEENIKKAQEIIKAYNAELQRLNDVDNMGSFDAGFNRYYDSLKRIDDLLKSTDISGQIGGIGASMQMLGSAMQQLGKDSEVAKVGLVVGAIGQLVLSFAQAMTSASKNWVTWLAFGLTGMATLTSIISQVQSFATGGIVQGSTTMGDGVVTRLNAGEMVLNSRQQNHLFNAIDKDKISNGAHVTVEGVVKGSDIYLSQRNYGRTKALVGKNTGTF